MPTAINAVRALAGDHEEALSLAHVTRAYGSLPILDDISMTIGRGEIVGLVGHSGSGKSTLLRLIAGLERPDAGTISIAGRQVFGAQRIVPTEHRGVGMVFQDYALFPHLTVLDNVVFGLSRRNGADALAAARSALVRVGLADRARDYPHALSGGEQQRVALVRALMPRPRILLLDEPFSNLDRRNRDTIRDETARLLRDSMTTAIVVTHEPQDAIRMTDRVMLLQDGGIVQDGPADDLYRNPATLTVARFFSEFNEIEATARGGHVDTALGRFAAPGFADGTRVVVCLRPHDIRVDDSDGDSALRGTVTARAFVGDEQMFALWVPGLPRPLQVRAPVHVNVANGGQIGFHLHSGNALVFRAVD